MIWDETCYLRRHKCSSLWFKPTSQNCHVRKQDVANAILMVLMISYHETANGSYPVEAVATMTAQTSNEKAAIYDSYSRARGLRMKKWLPQAPWFFIISVGCSSNPRGHSYLFWTCTETVTRAYPLVCITGHRPDHCKIIAVTPFEETKSRHAIMLGCRGMPDMILTWNHQLLYEKRVKQAITEKALDRGAIESGDLTFVVATASTIWCNRYSWPIWFACSYWRSSVLSGNGIYATKQVMYIA